jgi:uncharacterized repeat protein (TIGR04076 family)
LFYKALHQTNYGGYRSPYEKSHYLDSGYYVMTEGKMGNEKLDEGTKQLLRDVFGYNDEQIKIIESNPKWLKGIKAGPIMMSKKMVATCVKAQNCSMNVVGDRYVFTAHGTLLKDETCKRPCLWAMAQFLPFSYMLYDRVASGLDPNDMCTVRWSPKTGQCDKL